MNDSVIDRFRAALRIPTVWDEAASAESDSMKTENVARLEHFQRFLEEAFPLFHTSVEKEVLSPFALIYRWPGRGNGAPVLMLAHYDVVPVESAAWTVDPFGAELKDAWIWGRGSLDTKCTLIGAVAAAEELMESGFTPEQDIYFAFGGDEERSGELGAMKIVQRFRERGLRFSWLLDEGSIVADGILSGVTQPLALIGVEEKGYLSIELRVDQKTGHASRPPRVQAAAILARALLKIAQKPFPWRLSTSAESFFKGLAALAAFPRSFVLSHARALGRLFFVLAGKDDATAALLRTTVALTQLEGSPADNVMPSVARATLNLRLLPGRTVDSAIAYIKRAIGDPRVQVARYPKRLANDPVPMNAATADNAGWRAIANAVATVIPDALVLPFLVTATTDSRHYAPLCDAIYRFAPYKLNAEELARIHGHDERISLTNFKTIFDFYRELFENL